MKQNKEEIKILILGAGATGKDILELIEDINHNHPTYNCIGFLDDDPKKKSIRVSGLPVLGSLGRASEFKDCQFVNALGSTKNYNRIESIILHTGLKIDQFQSIIHPLTKISKRCVLGRGVVVFPYVYIGSNVNIGNQVVLLPNTTINHDSVLEDFTIAASGVNISGGTQIGKSCYLGSGCSVHQKISIGPNCLIGMGSIVIKNISANSVVAGNPALPIRSEARGIGTNRFRTKNLNKD